MADCWEPHRERIWGYFIQARMKLEEVMWHMEKYHGFSARFCHPHVTKARADSTIAGRHMSVNFENGNSASILDMLETYGYT
jgi:Clr5 domain